MLPPPYTTPDPTPFLPDHEHRHEPACSRGSSTSRSIRSSRRITTTTSSTRWFAEPRPAVAVHRQRDEHRDGRRQRARALPGSAGRPTPSTTAARSFRQRRQAAASRPASTSSRATSQLLTTPAARSTGSTRTAPSRPTTRSTTALGRTSTRSGRSGCATRSARPTTPRSGRLYIGDVGGNDYATAEEEIDIGAAGANYGWPNTRVRARRRARARSTPIRTTVETPRSPGGSSTAGPSSRPRIRATTSSPTTRRTGSAASTWTPTATCSASQLRAADGSVDGPYGDIVGLAEGPDGALYYIDLGLSTTTATFGDEQDPPDPVHPVNQSPTAVASADPTSGPAPLAVAFSSAGSADPEGQPLTYCLGLR